MSIDWLQGLGLFPYTMLGMVFSCIFVLLLLKPAYRVGLIDVPGGRKHHDGVTPVVGGLAVFLAFALTLALAGIDPPYYPFLAGAALLVLAGVIDDARDLSVRARLGVQVVAALFMCLWRGLEVTNLGDVLGFGEFRLGVWALPFTVFSVVGVINAVNMIDGIDGLAGGIAAVAMALLAVVGYLAGDVSVMSRALILMGCLLGFLVFNMRNPLRRRAAVFLGDAGSMFLGYVIAWFCIRLSQLPGDTRMEPAVALWILAVPLMDTVSVMLRRLRKGRSPFSADREHLHHLLLFAGYTPGQTAIIMIALSALLGGMGILAWAMGVPQWLLMYAFLGLFAVYNLGIAHAWKVGTFLRRHRGEVGGAHRRA